MIVFTVVASVLGALAVFSIGVCYGNIQQLTIQYKEGKKRIQELEDRLVELKAAQHST